MTKLAKEKIDVCLKEYDSLWVYYMHTLEERDNMINYYYRAVTIPGVLLGALAVVLRASNVDLAGFNVQGLVPVVSLILSVIFLVGVGQYVAYTMSSSNSVKYLKALNSIRAFLREQMDLDQALVLDKLRAVDNATDYGTIKLWRGSVIPIINSGIFCFLLMSLVDSYAENILPVWFMISMLSHLVGYRVIYQSY